MNELSACSKNIPIFEGTWTPPIKAEKVEFDKCVVSTDNLPSYIPNGYYKIVFDLKIR